MIGLDEIVSILHSVFAGRRARLTSPARHFQLTSQPLIAAVQREYPTLALELLNQGANPDTHKHWTWGGGLSVLDIIRQKMKDMCEFL